MILCKITLRNYDSTSHNGSYLLNITNQLQTLFPETIQLKHDYSLCPAAPSPPKNQRSPYFSTHGTPFVKQLIIAKRSTLVKKHCWQPWNKQFDLWAASK